MEKYAKAVLAFIGLAAANEAAVLTSTSAAAPVGLHGWVVAIATTVLGTFAVWAKSNSKSVPKV